MTPKPPRHVHPALAPLTRGNQEGTVYQRSAAVEVQIVSCLALSEDDIICRAQITEKDVDGYVQEEALIYLIRVSSQERSLALYNALSEILLTRCQDQLAFRFRSLEPALREDAYGEAVLVLFERVLSSDGNGDFFQVRFWPALDRLAVDVFRKCHRRQQKDRANLHPDSVLSSEGTEDPNEDWEQISAPGDEIPDEGRRSSAELDDLQAEALQVLEEPIRTAFILQHFEDWPIESKNPDDLTLSKYYNKTPRTIRNWLDKAERQLRDWRGEPHE